MIKRVYIAAPYSFKDNHAKLLKSELEREGIDVTSRWLEEIQDSQTAAAIVDIQDVHAAEAVVFMGHDDFVNSGSGGRHVEVGVALAMNIPVFILGQRSNVFHNLCSQYDDFMALIAALKCYRIRPGATPSAMSLERLIDRVHTANERWWTDLDSGQPLRRNVGELLMLVVSELAEAMEGHRKNLADDKLPQYPMMTVEIADALIRLFDIAGGMELDVAAAFEEKMRFNAVREDHTEAHRKSQHGKKY